MKFKLINGGEINLNVNKSKHPVKEYEEKKSDLQYNLGQVLLKLFPNYTVLEELYITKENLSLDFFIPKLKFVFEAHGQQHYKFIPHFHKFKHEFTHAKMKDNQKIEWCKINDIQIIIVPYTENNQEKIRNFVDKALKE